MSEPIITKKSEAGEPLSERWGMNAGYCLMIPIETAISEGGLGHCVQANLEIAESFNERYTIGTQFDYSDTNTKLLPSVNGAGRTHWGLMFGFGRISRLTPWFGKDGSLSGSLNFGVTPLIGGGQTKLGGGSQTLDGETFDFGSQKSGTWDIKTNYSLMAEFRPLERGPTILVGPEFAYGVQSTGDYSEFNRVGLELMFTIKLGYGDNSTLPGATVDTKLGAMGISQGIYSMAHGWINRYMMNKTLSDAQEALGDYTGAGDTADRGSLANVPVLEGSAAFLGGIGGGGMTTALRAGSGWYWGILAAQTAGGIGFLFSDGSSGVSGGVSDILRSARLAGYAMGGIESPDKRLALSSEEIVRREMYINFASFALNTAMMLGGGLGGVDSLATAGAAANIQISFSPDSAERGLAEASQMSLVPVSISGDKNGWGMRSGVRIHQSWHDFPTPDFQFFSQVTFLSPMFRADNLVNHVERDEPYGDAWLTTDIDASLGLEWKTRYTRLYFGIGTKGIFGGGEDQKVGIGGVAGMDVLIPISKRWSITLGAQGSAHKIFPKGERYEFTPSLGVEFSSDLY